MNELFKNRKITKAYFAITAERPNPIQGHLTHYILKDKSRNVAKAYLKTGNRTKEAKKSDLDYELISEVGNLHLIKVNPLTGRPHQIRVQLASIGCPIWGDIKYGFRKANRDGSIHLHCRSLAFEHPVKKEPVYIEAEVPDEQIWNEFNL